MQENLPTDGEKKREATDIGFYRKILRIPWMERVSNEEVFIKTATKRPQFLGVIMGQERSDNLTY